MINLIPSQQKKKIKKLFYLRFGVVVFIVLGLATVINAVLIAPSFFYLNLQKKIVENQLASTNEISSEEKENASVLLADLSKKIELIKSTQKSKFLVSEEVIKKVINTKTDGIKINEISYEGLQDKKFIEIKGEALSRENLIFYKNNLEKNTEFSKVDLPVSNFIKSRNIPFSLKIDII